MIDRKFLEKLAETRQGVIVPLHAIPRSEKFAVVGFDEWKASLVVRLCEKADKGKANKEILEKLRDFFNAEVEIIGGVKSKEKKLLVKATKQQLLERLSAPKKES